MCSLSLHCQSSQTSQFAKQSVFRMLFKYWGMLHEKTEINVSLPQTKNNFNWQKAFLHSSVLTCDVTLLYVASFICTKLISQVIIVAPDSRRQSSSHSGFRLAAVAPAGANDASLSWGEKAKKQKKSGEKSGRRARQLWTVCLLFSLSPPHPLFLQQIGMNYRRHQLNSNNDKHNYDCQHFIISLLSSLAVKSAGHICFCNTALPLLWTPRWQTNNKREINSSPTSVAQPRHSHQRYGERRSFGTAARWAQEETHRREQRTQQHVPFGISLKVLHVLHSVFSAGAGFSKGNTFLQCGKISSRTALLL